MNWLLNLKVAQKLALGFGICLFFAVIAGVVAVVRLGNMDAAANNMYTDSVLGNVAVTQAMNDIKQYRTWQVRYGISKNPTNIAACDAGVVEFGQKSSTDVADNLKSAVDPQDIQNAKDLETKWKALEDLTPRIRQVGLTGNSDQINAVIATETYPVAKEVTDQLSTVSNWNSDHGKKQSDQAHAMYLQSRTQIIGLLLTAIAFGIIVAIVVTKVIVNSLSEISERCESLDSICLDNLQCAVKAIAAGDLTYEIRTGTKHIDVRSTDEFGRLATVANSMITKAQGTIEAFRQAQRSLSTLIAQTNSAATTISTSSAELASGNEDLSNRTSEQASSLEETAASMEEMTSIVKQSAENAREANKLAAEARDVAQFGGDIVNKAVASMSEINSSSKRIADIISVIDEIAFQTNLLALNAAVEAARVGEQGRGFAVVASEVRNLAGRSSTAAKEIKALVNDSVAKVQEGTDLVNKSGAQLEGIVVAVNRVAEIVADITSAAQEQSAGIDQVNKAVIQMDEITQQNAALVEEATASSQAMSERARDLKDLVSRFKYASDSTVQTSALAQRSLETRATGTHGAPIATRSRNTALRVVSSKNYHDMDEF